MGKSIVVSATPERLSIAKAQMQGQDRDRIFSLPFIRGLVLNFLPDLQIIQPQSPPANVTFEVVERDEIVKLCEINGFDNALIYDPASPMTNDLVVTARQQDGTILGMAGSCHMGVKLRPIGIDVLPEYRHCGLAASLVNSLTFELLHRGYVPYYNTVSSNIASQRVAHRAGYYVAWVSDHHCNFEGLESSLSE
ncbi:GNAT family N-acetyltransferase [Paenibacillaceae bacterium]|nr:GNAT family N-acetyltransferase [Paenibacillaceae bacterium]